MFLTVTVAVAVGFLLILAMKKAAPPVSQEHIAAGFGEGLDPRLNTLSIDRFEWLCNSLLQKLGLEIERSMSMGERDLEMLAMNPAPIIGGQYLVHGELLPEGEVIEVVRVLALIDAVKGEGVSKGVLITNRFFSDEAANAAAGGPIELINGVRFQELLERFALFPTRV